MARTDWHPEQLSQPALEYIIRHVFLPPRLPQEDYFQSEGPVDLVRLIKRTVLGFHDVVSPQEKPFTTAAAQLVESMQRIHLSTGEVDQKQLYEALSRLNGNGAAVALHIRAQNAGLIITRRIDDVCFEAFELWPTNEAIMTTKGRLRRHFPAQKACVSLAVFDAPGFKATIAETLATMSDEDPREEMQHGDRYQNENHDTHHSGVVTELFMGFLGAVGEIQPVDAVTKHTREDVLGHSSAKGPWRRSPVWLLLRVSLQLMFSRCEPSPHLYKTFMVFLMGQIIGLARHLGIDSDTLYAMHAKMVRRRLKLGENMSAAVEDHVNAVVHTTEETLMDRWRNVQSHYTVQLDLSRLSTLDVERDTWLRIPRLDETIRNINREDVVRKSNLFASAQGLFHWTPDTLPDLQEIDLTENGQGHFNLIRFEEWVTSSLARWVEVQTGAETCEKLRKLLLTYHKLTQELYAGNPEGLSVAILTCIQLWKACDVAAIRSCSLIKEYRPGIDTDLLQNLLLPFHNDLKVLQQMELYIAAREDSAFYDLFLPTSHQHCFAARYVDRSKHHKNLLAEIKQCARRRREDKQAELRSLQSQYRHLMQQLESGECEYHLVMELQFKSLGETCEKEVRRHKTGCKRCAFKIKAENLRVEVDEWPLPGDVVTDKSVVFELQVPSFFAAWRDATAYLVAEVLQAESTTTDAPSTEHPLSKDPHLCDKFSAGISRTRIGLLSKDRPNVVVHRARKPVATASESTVCLENGLRYRYFDKSSRYFVEGFQSTLEMPHACTYQLPPTAASLQKFIFRPAKAPSGPSPNTVIATQADCPATMSLEEYQEMGGCTFGYRLQWFNLLGQLAAPSVDLKKPETTLLIRQCIYQAGPPVADNILRHSHAIAGSTEFAGMMLEVLYEALDRIRGNWESAHALGVLANVAARMLSLSCSPSMQRSLLDFLNTASKVCHGWVSLLRDRAQNVTTHEERTELMSKCTEIALICTTCFDVERQYLIHALKSTEQVSLLIQLSMMLRNGRQSPDLASGSILSILHWRFQRLLHRAYPQLKQRISGLDDAVRHAWSAYHPTSEWRVVSPELDQWMTTRTQPAAGNETMEVHYNLLAGDLLVDGYPIDRLPQEFEKTLLYATLFGQTTVEVMPSTVPGMQFSTVLTYARSIVHLGLDENANLRVHASQAGQAYHIIPAELFREAYPVHFVDKFVHWYNAATHTVHFRPIDDPWNVSSAEWVLHKQPEEAQWQLCRNRNALAGLQSTSVKILGQILSPLAPAVRIHIQKPLNGTVVVVDIPSLLLSFLLRPGDSTLESKQFSGQRVDPDQSVGCLVGLGNKLVMRHELNGSRMVLVPEGPITFRKSTKTGHVEVSVDTKDIITVHAYELDVQLGQLKDNGSLHSALLIAYLHALTSNCLPDPLTQKTGSEQALLVLSSARVRSFECLTYADMNVLEQIAHLTPRRAYYPQNERVMQMVAWSDDLGFMSQHHGLYQAVKSILSDMSHARIFNPKAAVLAPRLRMELFLLERESVRSSTFRVAGFGAEAFSTAGDCNYRARDQAYNSVRRSNINAISRVILNKPSNTCHWQPASQEELWNALSRVDNLKGAGTSVGDDLTTLRYSPALISPNVDIFSGWLAIHRQLRKLRDTPAEIFRVMMWFAALAFNENADTGMLQTLALCYSNDAMSRVTLPESDIFYPEEGYEMVLGTMQDLLRSALLPYTKKSPESKLEGLPSEDYFESRRRRETTFQHNRDRARNRFVEGLLAQWPCRVPQIPTIDSIEIGNYVDVERAMDIVQAKYKVWFDNLCLFDYVGNIERLAWSLPLVTMKITSVTMKKCSSSVKSHRYVSAEELFLRSPPPIADLDEPSDINVAESMPLQSSDALNTLIESLDERSVSMFERAYVQDLTDSFRHLHDQGDASNQAAISDVEPLHNYRQHCKTRMEQIFQKLRSALQPDVPASCAPRISHRELLEQLNQRRWKSLGQDWRQAIVIYGRAVTAFQRADRIVQALTRHDKDALVSEIRNVSHRNWDPLERPDSLLLEIESNITIRDVQEEIATQMRTPPDGHNAVMQLNMGEGKSSVIIPIVAAALADGTRLVRIVVPKPQSKQMAYMLRAKLSGLLHRRIYFTPFSRALQLSTAGAAAIDLVFRQCMQQGGVLLVFPEHVLSFELMALDHRLSGRPELSKALWDMQIFLDRHVRDIVDESDESFSVKFELIYTMGEQRHIELSPLRWLIIQQVLTLMRDFASELAKTWPLGLSVTAKREIGAFPHIQIVSQEAGDDLLSRIAGHICNFGLDGFPIARQPPELRASTYTYITCAGVSRVLAHEVEQHSAWSETSRSVLLLLRGLFAGGVLSFAFGQKRWRVHYGLARGRIPSTRLAVPYRAKDIPAPRSEFSHPDVLITLTSICYYYEGLQDYDMFMAVATLLRSDQADTEYRTWVKDVPNIPPEFRSLQSINLQDRDECISKIFPHLCRTKSVIDFYLSRVVFPREIRGFPSKLSASGWDLGKSKKFPNTGFSGTNDTRKLLPLDVNYVDLPSQAHTNALVLHYLLQPENSVALLDPPTGEDVHHTDAARLLDAVMKLDAPVQVILDVGAQILELDNLGVAQTWLRMHTDEDIQAVVYFDALDELSVVDRHGHIEALQTSSFATRLHVCIVYLDEAHTRGTDLKLPSHYRAAVILGAQLTKDRLVQACMRMRKLGKGQTVVFCVPKDIQSKINSSIGRPPGTIIRVADVLFWAITETYADIRRSAQLWATQGRQFVHQDTIRKQSPFGELPAESFAQQFLQDDMLSLAQRYGVGHRSKLPDTIQDSSEYGARIAARCVEFEYPNIRPAMALAEEQERELAPEMEEERQMQRPAAVNPATHRVHPDVVRFVSHGMVQRGSHAYAPAFCTLRVTSAAKSFDPSTLDHPDLLVSTDFVQTVQEDVLSFDADAYQRSVRWILAARAAFQDDEAARLMIISPFEAQELMDDVRKSAIVSLHMYKPHWNLTYRRLDRMDVSVPVRRTPLRIPRVLALRLGIFAGQLYLSSFDDYTALCRVLGLASEPTSDGWIVDAHGFILRDPQGRVGADSGLLASPVEFCKILLAKIRRHGADIGRTHMGRLLDGDFLHGIDFEP